MVNLPISQLFSDFQFEKNLGSGTKGDVFLVKKKGQLSALKIIPIQNADNAEEEILFNKECSAMAKIDSRATPQVFEFGKRGGFFFISMEYFDGLPFHSLLIDSKLMEIEIIKLLIKAASGLADIHKCGVVHRDINLENILVNSERDLKIIDFGLAAEIGTQNEVASDTIVGSFHYLSPEQLKVIVRSVDGRSDLFSLGVIFYKILTGVHPFPGETIEQVIEAQKTLSPAELSKIRPGISTMLDKIVRKLIQIEPLDRYQTSVGLVSDLRRLQELVESGDSQVSFQMGEFDLQTQNQFEVPLVGRDKEISILQSHFAKSFSGHGRGYIIKGLSGLGKSRLINEVLKDPILVGPKKLRAKCSPYDILIPFSGIRKIFASLVESLMENEVLASESNLNKIRDLSKGCEPAIFIVGAQLSKILGISEEVDSSIDESLIAAQISNFISRLSIFQKGITVAIDDIQWIDAGSIRVLQKIFSEIEQNPIFFLFSARQEAEHEQVVLDFINTINSELLFMLELKPMGLIDIQNLVQKQLAGRRVSEEVIRELFEHSQGNAFVAIETISSLLSEGYLNISDGTWSLVEGFSRHLKYNNSMNGLLQKKIRSLASKILKTMSTMAVFGPSIPSSILSKIIGLSAAELAEFLVATQSLHMTEQTSEGVLTFVHDRVREAVLDVMGTEAKESEHFAILNFLLQSPGLIDTAAFEIANHSMEAKKMLSPEKVFEYQVLAGMKASSEYAKEAAFLFFQRAKLVEPNGVTVRELKLEYYSEFGYITAEIGKTKEAKELLDSALTFVNTPDEKVIVLNHMGALCLQEGKITDAWNIDFQILELLGHSAPRSLAKIVLQIVFTFIWTYLLMPVRRGVKTKTLNSVIGSYARLVVMASFMGKKPEAILFALRYLKYAKRIGPGIELLKAYGIMASVFAVLKNEKAMEKLTGKAIQISTELNTSNSRAYALMNRAFALERIGKSIESDKVFRDVIPYSEMALSNIDFSLCWLSYAWSCFARGKILESLETIFKYSAKTNAYGRVTAIQNIGVVECASLLISGQIEKAEKLKIELDQKFNYFDKSFKFIYVKKSGLDLVFSYEKGIIDNHTMDAMKEFEEIDYDFIQTSIFWVYAGYIKTELVQRSKGTGSFGLQLQNLISTIQKLDRYLNIPMLRCHYFVLMASILRFENNFKKASKYLDAAEQLAVTSDCPFGLFMLQREKAFLFKEQNLLSASLYFARSAEELARNLGWQLRLSRIKQEFPEINQFNSVQNLQENTKLTAFSSEPSTGYSEALLRVTLASSFEIDPKKQMNLVLDEIIQIVKSERCFIFLKDSTTEELRFSAGRNSQREDLDEPKGYSSTILKKVLVQREPISVVGNDEIEALGSQSAMAHGLRTVMAAPLICKGAFIGAIYLDSSIRKGVYSKADLQLLSALAAQISISIENLRVMESEAQKRELEKDLELSAMVQKMLFPVATQLNDQNFFLEGFSRSAVQCGGDWWWYNLDHESKKLKVFVGDVTGHGAGPAMITAYLSSCFWNYERIKKEINFSEFLGHLNETIYNLSKGEFLVSGVGIEVDLSNYRMTVWNCGFHGVYHFKQNGDFKTVGGSGNLIGGEEFESNSESTQLEPDDQIFVATDGLLELPTKAGDQLGRRRALKLVGKHLNEDRLESKIKGIVSEIDQLSSRQDDDITLVYFRMHDRSH